MAEEGDGGFGDKLSLPDPLNGVGDVPPFFPSASTSTPVPGGVHPPAHGVGAFDLNAEYAEFPSRPPNQQLLQPHDLLPRAPLPYAHARFGMPPASPWPSTPYPLHPPHLGGGSGAGFSGLGAPAGRGALSRPFPPHASSAGHPGSSSRRGRHRTRGHSAAVPALHEGGDDWDVHDADDEADITSSSGGGGGIAAMRGMLTSSGAGDGALEDRLSTLPDDVLVLILLRLGRTAEAARTSVLSRRWPRVWHLLPALSFYCVSDSYHIREVLVAPDAPPPLHSILAMARDSTPDTLGAWLPDAARRLSGMLFYFNTTMMYDDEEEEDGQDGETGAVQLPCFENATFVYLHLGNLGLTLPFAGTFACLVDLSLSCIRLHGSCELGDVVSQRCPSLQSLSVDDTSGVDKLIIHSESLLKVDLRRLNGLRQLTVVAPGLKELTLCNSFVHNQPVADISAPQLVLLEWRDSYDPSSVQLGNISQLQRLGTDIVFVYSKHGSEHNRAILKLLQWFRSIQTLSITLSYPLGIDDYQYSMEDITMLPPTTFLKMAVKNEGHDFGPSTFHVLRRCTGIRRLELVLHGGGLESACHSGCNCDQPIDWKAEELSLNCLEEVELTDLKGADHEVVFMERLSSWATVVKKIRVTFHYSVSKSKAREILQTLSSFSRSETLAEFYMYHDNKVLTYLLAPEAKELSLITD